VYPYGASLNVRKPSYPLLSSGPISFPPNRPLAAFHVSPKKGKLIVVGSIRMFDDTFFEKEDNQKIQEAFFKWLLSDSDLHFERNIKDENDITEYSHVPDITALADRLRSCLQESDELPKDFRKMYNDKLYKFDTDLVPETIALYD